MSTIKNKLLCLAILFSASTQFVIGQRQFSGWLASFNTIKTGKSTSIHADVQLRSSDEMKHIQALLIRGGLNYHLNKQWTVTAGYAFVNNSRTISGVNGYVTEHRLWEQVLYNHKLGAVHVSHRLRLEQRFISKAIVVNNELENEGNLYANRARYFIRNILPFRSSPSFTKGLFAALQDEVFINVGNKANVNGESFDQNRLLIALGYRLSKKADLETGYLYQSINGRNGATTDNHVLQLGMYLRL